MVVEIPVIYGPTASGKTAFANKIASSLEGVEIISVDSRQIYKGLDIGTAKPTMDELRSIPHHLINTHSITSSFSVGDFFSIVPKLINDIASRGNIPLIVGGSTLYLNVLFNGLSLLPASVADIRIKLENELRIYGSRYLYAKLYSLDPFHARTMDHTKTQRVIRSLEIIELTETTVTEVLKKSRPQKIPNVRFLPFFLDLPKDILYNRINERVEVMFQNGLIEEANQFFSLYSDYDPIPAPLNTIGYKEIFDALKKKCLCRMF